jgi:hypothetical protein
MQIGLSIHHKLVSADVKGTVAYLCCHPLMVQDNGRWWMPLAWILQQPAMHMEEYRRLYLSFWEPWRFKWFGSILDGIHESRLIWVAE